jgi:hypothetical protein
MRVAVITSASANIGEYATLTIANKVEYCLRHGYSLVMDNQPYYEVIHNTHWLCEYLDRFELVWMLDSDAVITDMRQPIHELQCLGPHVTVCEEGIVDWNRINCGSVVCKDTLETRTILQTIAIERRYWEPLACGWQTWLAAYADARPERITVAPLRAFNSCVWNRPANARDEIGGHWQPGDFVYHPCGVYPQAERTKWIREALCKVIR